MSTPREVKVGAFVLAGLVIIGFVIFLIGDERQLFASKYVYYAHFKDVEGLKRGSPVQMGGVDVGSVSEVAYSDDAKDPTIYVTMDIVAGRSKRIREDSVASIAAKGLLGDKMIVITVGSPDKPPIPPGGIIKSQTSDSMTEMLSTLGRVTTKVERVVGNLEKTTSAFAEKEFHDDLKSTADSLSGVLKSLDQGEGYMGRLLKDPEEAERISRLLQNLETTSQQLAQTSRSVNAIVHRVSTGPGFAHDVIYGEGLSKTAQQFGGAAEELSKTLKGVREGNGLARSFIYGDDQSQQIMGNLNAMSGDLRQIVADVRAGKGTIGALLVDPSVYEDVKLLLGNVQRNKTLRALVRYSIKRDEKGAPSVEVRDPEPAKPETLPQTLPENEGPRPQAGQ